MKKSQGEPIILGQVYHRFDEPPKQVVKEHGYSQDVLIDLDGEKKHWAIGWYDYDEKAWRFYQSDVSHLAPEDALWTNLPI